jgi:hypothetical protein
MANPWTYACGNANPPLVLPTIIMNMLMQVQQNSFTHPSVYWYSLTAAFLPNLTRRP